MPPPGFEMIPLVLASAVVLSFIVGVAARGWGTILLSSFLLGLALVAGIVVAFLFSTHSPDKPLLSPGTNIWPAALMVLVQAFVFAGFLVLFGGLGYGLKKLFVMLFLRKRVPTISHG